MSSALNALLKTEASLPAKIVNFQSQSIVKSRQEIDPAAHLTVDQRAVMKERTEFCRCVWKLLQGGEKQADAVVAVASRVSEFPLLARGGKGESNAMTIHNYRAWIRRLGKWRGQPDWNNAVALADQYCKNVRGASGSPEFWKTFNGFYLTENKLGISEAYRLAKDLCRKWGIKGVPSERQVRYWYKVYADQAAVMAARYGETWFENSAMSYIRRDWSSVQANEIWIGDHHVFDATVRVWNEDKKSWQAVRPWLTAWLDAKSLWMPGICVRSESPDHVAILTALQNGIRSAGNEAPAALYTDNGKDFLKQGLGTPFIPKDTKFEHSVCKELAVKTIRSLPYKARAKTIERIFKEACERFSRRWAQYLGNRPGARPEVAGYFYKNPELLPSLCEFTEQFLKWLDEEYHTKPQDGKILDGKCPTDAWKERPAKRKFTDEELWFSMLTPYSRNCPTVERGAAVVIDKKEYRNDSLWPFFQKKIMVKLDPVNGGNPQAFTLDGKYICSLQPENTVPAYAQTKEDRALISEQIKRQRLEMKRAFGIADEMSEGRRKLSPQEQLSLNPAEHVEIIKLPGSHKSVKGNTHNFVLHQVKPGQSGSASAPLAEQGDGMSKLLSMEKPTAQAAGETKGQERKRELEAFHEAQTKNDGDTEETSSRETIADFHKMIINNQNQGNALDHDSLDW